MNFLVGDDQDKDLELYGYSNNNGWVTDTNSNEVNPNTLEYLYGTLNKEVENLEYKGKGTDTAKVIVDNEKNEIYTNVLKVPGKLILTTNGEILGTFDGSSDTEIDLKVSLDASKYITRLELEKKLSKEAELRELSDNKLQLDIQKEAELREKTDLELQTKISTVSNLLEDINNELTDKINQEIADRELDDKALENKLKEETLERQQSDILINTKISKIRTDLAEESKQRQLADQELDRIKLNKANADVNLVTDAIIKISGDNVTLNKDYINLATQQKLGKIDLISLATKDNAGMMSKADYSTLYDLKERVEGLEGKTTRLFYTGDGDPSQEDIEKFVTDLGYERPFEGIAVVVKHSDGSYHIWHYYENDNIGWRDDGIDTVTQFTNDTAGIIKGSSSKGKVYAETDGTGSVYGWDELENKVDTNTQNISNNADVINELNENLETEITDRENADTELQNNINKEVDERQTQDNILENLINKENERAVIAESDLDDKFSKQYSELDKKISAETDTRQSQANILENLINKEVERSVTTDDDLKSEIEALKAQLEKGVSNTIIRRWEAD